MQNGGSTTTDTTKRRGLFQKYTKRGRTTLCVRHGSAVSCKSSGTKQRTKKCQRFLARARRDFTENINHNLGLFNGTTGERQDPAKDILCRRRGLRFGKRHL